MSNIVSNLNYYNATPLTTNQFTKFCILKTKILQISATKLILSTRSVHIVRFEIDLQPDLLCSELVGNSWHSIRIAEENLNSKEMSNKKRYICIDVRHEKPTQQNTKFLFNVQCCFSEICMSLCVYMFCGVVSHLKLIVCVCLCMRANVFVHTW